MKFANALSDFLYDKKYFITIFEDKVHIYRFFELKKLTNDEIILKLENFDIIINGNKLCVLQMNNEEIIIQGNITNIGKIYE